MIPGFTFDRGRLCEFDVRSGIRLEQHDFPSFAQNQQQSLIGEQQDSAVAVAAFLLSSLAGREVNAAEQSTVNAEDVAGVLHIIVDVRSYNDSCIRIVGHGKSPSDL